MREATTTRKVTTEELDAPLVSYEDAVRLVVTSTRCLQPQPVNLPDALDKICAADIDAPIDVPPFDNSSMDGWAVDTFSFAAGTTSRFSKISTGAPLPADCNAVIPWETATLEPERATTPTLLRATVEPGAYVRRAGHDLRSGDRIASKGETLDAFALSTLASCGIADVDVFRCPRVGVLVSGSELVAAGSVLSSALTSGQLFDSNSVLLSSLLARSGVGSIRIERVPDDEDETRRRLVDLVTDCDLVITTGGASVGERDWVRHCVGQLGNIALWRVGIRPGKPFALADISNVPVMSLPGNPSSVATCFHAFVTRAIRIMQGRNAEPRAYTGRLSESVINQSERTLLCPARIEADNVVPAAAASSQAISHMRHSAGFFVVPPLTTFDVGRHVEVELHS